MYTLYYSPASCSLITHFIFNHLNIPFKLEKVDLKNPSSVPPAFFEIKPKYSVPAITKGDFSLIEGAAIALHLFEEKPDDLLPSKGLERSKALQWYIFTNATLHPAFGKEWKAAMFVGQNTDEAKAYASLAPMNRKGVQDLLDMVETQLNKTKFLAGEKMTIADIAFTVITNWVNFLPKEPKEFVLGPKTRELMNTVSALPAFQKSLQEEGIEFIKF